MFFKQLHIRPVLLDPSGNCLQGSLDLDVTIADHGAGEDGLVPLVLQVHFGDGEIELFVQARQQRLEAAALFFQGGAAGNLEMEGENSDHGKL